MQMSRSAKLSFVFPVGHRTYPGNGDSDGGNMEDSFENIHPHAHSRVATWRTVQEAMTHKRWR